MNFPFQTLGDQLPQVLQKVQVSQHLNQQLPLQSAFVDETGKQVVLGDYFGKRPAVLALVYYNCPMLCSEEMVTADGPPLFTCPPKAIVWLLPTAW